MKTWNVFFFWKFFQTFILNYSIEKNAVDTFRVLPWYEQFFELDSLVEAV